MGKKAGKKLNKSTINKFFFSIHFQKNNLEFKLRWEAESFTGSRTLSFSTWVKDNSNYKGSNQFCWHWIRKCGGKKTEQGRPAGKIRLFTGATPGHSWVYHEFIAQQKQIMLETKHKSPFVSSFFLEKKMSSVPCCTTASQCAILLQFSPWIYYIFSTQVQYCTNVKVKQGFLSCS